ncbi:MAG TPA: glycosyltransferase [Candidatus Spyradenecus faecavium]|uniref:Glycosyltransferase n=1 Tax=Candidatus Spyradenecus faecavium TaxID=2840947 RepID=A0A9D1NMK1_9BACT|nr:glycosyltransferase [Candidatus Spyradenecus faecavium]
MKLVYWTVFPNLHQRAWIDALRAAGCDVEVCYFGHYDAYRAALGWAEPTALPPQERRVSTLREALAAIPDYAARLIILTGYAERVYWDNVRFCEARGVPWCLIAEKSQGRARSWPLRRLFARHVNRSAVAAFGLGPEAVDDLVRGWGVRRDKAAELAYATPGASTPAKPRPHAGFRFVFAGAFTHRKAVDVLARAWAEAAPRLPEATLRVIGAGPLGAAFDGLPRVERFGVCPPERIPEALDDCDCGILPSRFDGWGMAVAEYARAGLTLIATQTCGAAEPLIRPDHNGFIVPPEDVAALAQAMVDASALRPDAAPLAATDPAVCARRLLDRLAHPAPYEPPRHLLHVAAGCWERGGGLSESLAETVLAQARAGFRVTLAFLGGQTEHPLVRDCRRAGATVWVFPRSRPHCLYFSRAMLRTLSRLIRRATQVHIHGCWTFPVWWAATLAQYLAVPYVVSPCGSLGTASLRKSRLRKWLAWWCFDKRDCLGAAWLRAKSQAEAEWMTNALGSTCPPIRVIPNGVDGDLLDAVPDRPRTQTFLFLGRLHPLKGLDLLAEAWRLADLGPAWRLVIAGPADGAEPPNDPGVEVVGPLSGADKARALKSAACLVLPTRSENFGIVVAEALWCRTPVICTKGAPWPELGEYWVDVSAEALADALRRFAALTPAAREARFAPLFAAARERFAWPALARALADDAPPPTPLDSK